MSAGGLMLSELVSTGLAKGLVGADVRVTGVRHDSRAIERGDLFVALAGRRAEGATYARHALERGASAVAAEAPIDGVEAPTLLVDDARRALAPIASKVYGEPTRALAVIGLTGTNGKTTTAWQLEAALALLGAEPALLGTIEARGPGGLRAPAPLTTPEGDEVARFARAVLERGATHLVMEVSSHALIEHRVEATHFRVAAFTNLSQDHLDFHGDMEAYFQAKARLFTELTPEASVIHVGDAAGARLAEQLGERALTVAADADRGADLFARGARFVREGLAAELVHGEESAPLESRLVGAHNLENLVVAAGCLVSLGYSLEDAARALREAPAAPGRLERVEGLDDVMILVDYAHTPDALARALAALRPLTPGRLITVFGCGGDRDVEKRPLMGAAASEGGDLAILTSDNPRTEDPFAIIAAIAEGARDAGSPRLGDSLEALRDAARGHQIIEDRGLAIRRGVLAARPGDTVLIAGKGHEDYQIRGEQRFDFDDRVEANAAIALARGRAD